MQKIPNVKKQGVPRLEQLKTEIEARAKVIFAERQKTSGPGDSLSDWLKAEKEIKAKYRIS
jgi:hypothetical protein